MPGGTKSCWKTIQLFESLTDEELKSLARRLDHAEFSAGDKIFGQGESGSAAFIIEDGAVEISYGTGTGKVVLANLFAAIVEVPAVGPLATD